MFRSTRSLTREVVGVTSAELYSLGMPRALAIVATVLAGCGSTAPVPTVAMPVPPAAKPTCEDVGVILRGPLDDEAKGRDLEHAIAKTCGEGRWGAQIVDCVASTTDPDHCLDRLSTEQHQAYRLVRGDSGPVSAKQDDAPPPPIECADAFVDVALLAPAIALAAGPDRDWAIAVRASSVVDSCQHTPSDTGWSELSRACFIAARDPDALAGCHSQLDSAQAQALAHEVSASDAIVARSLALLRKEPPVTCNGVASHYYADAAWAGKLDGLTAAQRKKAIADSRAAMTKACTQETWDGHERACLVVGGGARCFAAAGSSSARWSFPSVDQRVPDDISQCAEYNSRLAALAQCDKMTARARAAAVATQSEGFAPMFARARATAGDPKRALADACTAAADALGQLTAQLCQ